MALRSPLFVFIGMLLTAQAQSPQVSKAQTLAGAPQDPGMHAADKPPAVASTALSVQTPSQSLSLSPADLQAMPQATITVHNGHTGAEETYTGPLLAAVLAKAGLGVTPRSEHEMLRMYVVATGTDGYSVVYSAAEVEPTLHKAQVIVALSQDGKPLARTGAFQLIDSLEVKPARWVRNLSRILVTALPSAETKAP